MEIEWRKLSDEKCLPKEAPNFDFKMYKAKDTEQNT